MGSKIFHWSEATSDDQSWCRTITRVYTALATSLPSRNSERGDICKCWVPTVTFLCVPSRTCYSHEPASDCLNRTCAFAAFAYAKPGVISCQRIFCGGDSQQQICLQLVASYTISTFSPGQNVSESWPTKEQAMAALRPEPLVMADLLVNGRQI